MSDVAHSTTSITGGHANVVAAGAAGFMSGADKTKLNGIATGADVTAAALVTAGTTTADVAAAALAKIGGYSQIAKATLTLGTGAVLSLTDASFSGKTAGGRGDLQGASGVLGIVAGSFASIGAETGTGAGQAGLGSAAASGQPYNVSDFPGQNQYAQCVLLTADRKPITLVQMLAGTITDATAEVYGYLSFRSDLGANLKWRLYFYYRRAADGLEVPFTPTVSLANCWLEVPEIFLAPTLAPGFGLSQTTAGPAVSPIPTLDKVPAPIAAVALNAQKITGLGAATASTDAVQFGQTAPGIMTGWGAAKNAAAATTRYLALGAVDNFSTTPVTTEASSNLIAPAAGVITGLYVFVGSATIVDSYTFFVRVNGVNTAITCVIAGSGTAANDTAHTASFAAGDRISIQCTQSSTAASITVNLTASLSYRAV